MPTASTSSRRNSAGVAGQAGGYYADSQRPIVIFAFLLPLIILYEIGTRLFPTGVAAFFLLAKAGSLVDVYGSGVPAGLLILSLLVAQLIRAVHGDRNLGVNIRTLPIMLMESCLLALPVFGISLIARLLLDHIPTLTVMSGHSLVAHWFLSIGAGVYEELLFRFFGCGALNLLFTKAFGASKLSANVLTIAISSVLFSLYHYLGNEHFALYTFLFRALAGGYFALVFLNRGLGISAGAHAIYDIVVVTLRGI